MHPLQVVHGYLYTHNTGDLGGGGRGGGLLASGTPSISCECVWAWIMPYFPIVHFILLFYTYSACRICYIYSTGGHKEWSSVLADQ